MTSTAPAPAMLDNLPEEILEKVVLSCTVKDVLSLACVDKALSAVCNSRPVWTHFLRKLKADETPNLPPHVSLDDLSNTCLKEIVLDAKRRRHAWRTDCDVTLEITELLKVPTDKPWRLNPRLLPGGKHVLLDYRGNLELWSVESKVKLWSAPAEEPHHVCVTFDFDIVESGRKVNFAGWFERDDGLLYVRVFSYDLRAGAGHLLLQRDLRARFIWKLLIRGHLLMIHMPNACQIFLVNIEDQSTVIIEYSSLESDRSNARACLVEDKYLAISLRHNDYIVACMSIASLEGHWSRSSKQADWPVLKLISGDKDGVKENGEVGAAILRLWDDFGDGDPWIASINATPQRWRLKQGDAEMVVIAFVPQSGQMGRNYFLSTRVRLGMDGVESKDGSGRGWRLTLVEQLYTPCKDLPWYPQNVSHSGRMIALQGNMLNVYDLSSGKEQPGKVIPVPTLKDTGDLVDGLTINTVEPWSETVTVGLSGRIGLIKLRSVKSKPDGRLKPSNDSSDTAETGVARG